MEVTKQQQSSASGFGPGITTTILPWIGVALAILIGRWQDNPNLTYLLAAPCIIFNVFAMLQFFLGQSQFVVDGRTVVITGGSQGMGRGLAKCLSAKGANVVIVARNEKNLEEALEYAKAAALRPNSQRFHSISADVTVFEENTRIIDEVTTWNNGVPPDIVWANAGISIPCLFLDATIEQMKTQMDVNYWSVVYLAKATLNAWLVHGGSNQVPANARSSQDPLPRHFVTTSSVAAFCGLAGYSPYSPSKAAIRSLHDSLRSEMNLYSGARSHPNRPCLSPEIKFHSVYPGTILSPGYEQENKSKHAVTKLLEEGDSQQTGDEVATISVKELEKGRSIITTQLLAAAMRASSMQGSPRDRWFVDTVFAWAVSIAWLFIAPDMESTIRKWGYENGMPDHSSLAANRLTESAAQ